MLCCKNLPNDSEPELDLAIVKPLGQIYLQRQPGAEDIFGLVDSNTSLSKDLDAKRKAYAAALIQDSAN